ncbi:hypothetical protein GL286_17495 [Paracoccus aestuariivivens]|uniref:Uncharacterized protein n=1 Tax=Paracoccus aestuariivivens TaxID=1820333 RepID=A0A6L6JHZ2_9RHOB|nr:hypothetical protein [Paracoccus aestuariivivens]
MSPPKGDKSAPDASTDKAADRIARRAANQAEREARRAANQAERDARKGKKPKSGVASESDDQPPVSSTVFNVLLVAQAGRLEREAALFAASLRRNAPDWNGRLIIAEPREEAGWAGESTRISSEARTALENFGAEILPFTARHFGKDYPYGNKIEAMAVLPSGQPFIFFDSDTVITKPINRAGIDFSRPSASMRRTGTWPSPPLYGPGPNEIWKSLYDRFGLQFSTSLDLSQPDEHWERYLYFNAGWFLGPDPQEFGQKFLQFALAIRDEPGEELACQSLDPWLDQIALPLVIHALGGGRPDKTQATLDGVTSCHYRNLPLLYARESEETIALVEDLMRDPRLAALFRDDEAFGRVIAEGLGRSAIRPMFENEADLLEQPIRHKLKREGLWFR